MRCWDSGFSCKCTQGGGHRGGIHAGHTRLQGVTAGETRQALDLVRERTESRLALCLKTAWTAPGGGLVNTGRATACSPRKALKWIELLLVYPWKFLVHLHGTERGLGLGVCTLHADAQAQAPLGPVEVH